MRGARTSTRTCARSSRSERVRRTRRTGSTATMSEAHEEQHERLEREAEDMQRKSDQLGDQIADVKQDWDAKRRDESIAGAATPEGGEPGGDDVQDPRDEPWPD